MTRRILPFLFLAVVAGCLAPEDPPRMVEYAWQGSSPSLGALAVGADDEADSVTYGIVTDIDMWYGGAQGVLSIMGNARDWRYDPYRG